MIFLYFYKRKEEKTVSGQTTGYDTQSVFILQMTAEASLPQRSLCNGETAKKTEDFNTLWCEVGIKISPTERGLLAWAGSLEDEGWSGKAF